MLVALQTELQLLLGDNRTKEVLHRLRDHDLQPGTKPHQQVYQLLGRFNRQRDERIAGTITYEDEKREHLKIHQSLLELVDRLMKQDLRKRAEPQAPILRIPEYHALSVNRHEQTNRFLDDHDREGLAKLNVYYLQGDKRQMARSLALRFRHMLHGRMLMGDLLGEEEDGDLPSPIYCPTQLRGNVQSYRIGIVQSIAQHFLGRIRMNQRARLGKMSLLEMLRQSPYAKMDGADALCIIITINESSWDKDIVPEALRELLRVLRSEEIPEEFPSIYLFFGLQYEPDSTRVASEVEAAMKVAQFGTPMTPLLPVPSEDIAEWFDLHPTLLGKGESGQNLVKDYFPDPKAWDMADVEHQLEKLLRDYNSGLLDRP